MSAGENQHITDDAGFPHHNFYAEIPNLLDDSELDPFAFRLYCHYKRVAGAGGGTFEESVRTSAERCRMSVGAVVKARVALVDGGWIAIEAPEETGRGKPASRIAIVDRWQEGIQRYRPGSVHVVNTSPGSVHVVNGSVHVVNTSLSSSPEKNREEHIARTRVRASGEPSLTDEQRERLHTTYDAMLGGHDEVEEIVALALDHKSAKNYTHWNLYVANWLRRESERRRAAPSTNSRYQRVDHGDRNAEHEDPGADPHVNFTLREDPEYVKRWNREHPDKAWDASKERLRG